MKPRKIAQTECLKEGKEERKRLRKKERKSQCLREGTEGRKEEVETERKTEIKKAID